MASPTKPNVLRFGVFEFNLVSRELRKDGMRVRLEGQPLTILEILLEQPGQLVTREELQKVLWPGDTFVDFEHSLNAAVKRLRAALNDSAEQPRYIETQARRGYRFIAPLGGVGASDEAFAAASTSMVGRMVTGRGVGRWSVGAAIALCVAGLLGWGWRHWTRRPITAHAPVIRSLAVLPLENLSRDPSQDYFADGMTEAIIGRLSMIHGLRVISRTSVMHFKDTRASVPEIAKTLGVDAIVEGSIIREGGRVRVHVQLIRVATDEHFWSETYDRELGDTLALESEVAQAIAGRVEVTVTGVEHARLVAARQVSPEVYESYLKGQFTHQKGNSPAAMEKSIAYFEEAIKKDPEFAPAYLGLAQAYDALGQPGVGGAPPSEVQPQVISAARKALELDPALPGAHALMGDLYQIQWQWNAAEREYKLALELNPNDAGANLAFAQWLMIQGRTEEAVGWSRRARELEPLGITGNTIGWILFQARHYDEAIRELRSNLAVRRDDASTYWSCWFLGFALIAKGQADEAIPVLEKALALSQRNPAVIGVLIRAYAHAGRRTQALRLLDELNRRQQKGYIPAVAFVNAYLGLGNNEQAFVWLDHAYQEHAAIMQLLKVHPFLDPLRGDPRFDELLRRVGLAP
jgi:TolB-like protein/DNA-binding winged helix-turn-helix (wHTH) protein/Tfp pilus assembly protein PilF